jgi:Protein of unknown function (DUF669)
MGKKYKINFEGVDKEIRKGGGGGTRIPEGDYLAKIIEAEINDAASGSRYFRWKMTVATGEFKGKSVYMNTSLKPNALWNLRNLIHAATGKNVAGSILSFDPDKLYGKSIGIAVEDNEYTKDGKTKITSQVAAAFPAEELEDEDEDDEDEEEEEDEEDEEDLEEVDVEEL